MMNGHVHVRPAHDGTISQTLAVAAAVALAVTAAARPSSARWRSVSSGCSSTFLERCGSIHRPSSVLTMPLFNSWRHPSGTMCSSMRKSAALLTSAGSLPPSLNSLPRPW
uniref:Uncharacterized protein n=1 Tax=Triticum urartu TaxID=4572 RepID=A0A8R7PXT1_TRIUA